MRAVTAAMLLAFLAASAHAAEAPERESADVDAALALTPIVRLPPAWFFPRKVWTDGVCDVTFTVLASGVVDEDSIVANCSPAAFERPAARLIARQPYPPLEQDAAGVTEHLEFNYEERPRNDQEPDH